MPLYQCEWVIIIITIIKKAPVRRGSCNWCKKQAVLLDFSSVLDGREIYCTGLCSDKCFTEAAKQIVTIENGSTKPRYYVLCD